MKNENKCNLKNPLLLKAIGVMAILFGFMTVKEGGTVLFTVDGNREAGNIVPFVLWFNFFAGFAYIIAGIMLIRLKSGSQKVSAVIAIATTIVFVLLGVHILNGGVYELRTVTAMTIRSGFWIAVMLFSSWSRSSFRKV